MALYAFDGTGKSANLANPIQGDESNVALFSRAYGGTMKYFQGVGTKLGPAGQAVGGAFGAGDLDRLNDAYKKLCETWQGGDHVIDIIGFSRGSALALDFANNVEAKGIRRPGSDEVVEQKPAIRFVGLWDVVGAFGLAVNVGLEFQKINLGHHLFIPDNVQYCFHAISMDERRQTFRVTRVLNGYEVWFRGVHSDVGGGNGNTGLSNIALRWMYRKALAAGLPISEAAIAALEINPDAAIRPPLDFIPNAYRQFLPGDRYHYTVTVRPKHNNPPDDFVKETEADELKAIPMASLAKREGVGDETPPGDHLEVGEKAGKLVHARNCWNTVGIEVKKGERYDVSATGEWKDQQQHCSAAGYEKWFLTPFKGTRRVSKSHWFCLIAAVHPSHVLEFEEPTNTNTATSVVLEAFGRTVHKRDDESQLVAIGEQGSITIDRDGYLYLFANDTPGAYANNSGDVQATVVRAE